METTTTAPDPGSTQVATPQATSSPSTPVESQPIDLDENALIRIKGSEKPVKFGEHVKGLQAQFTKASQEAARHRKELEQERQLRQRLEAAQRQQQQPQGQAQNDVYAALKALPYLTGEDAVQMVTSIVGEVKQRDQVLLATLKQLQDMKKIVDSLYQNHSTTTFDAKINKWLTEGGYDPGYADLAKEIYLAYEGDDLDTEFPQIFASRVEQIRKIEEARKAAAVNAAKRSPFVPGKGGQANPSKPLQMTGKESSKEITEMLWALQQGSET